MAKKEEKANQVKKKTGKSFFEKYRFELIIFVFSLILYANAVPNGYNMDDELVTRDHRLTSKGISALGEIFTTSYYKDNSGYSYEYRPMVLASFAIEHSVFGDNPFISHLINVLLYGLCCVLLFFVLQLVTKGFSILVPLGITLLFAVHPAHTEVVASIKNRDEILGLIFSLLAWLAAFKGVKGNTFWFLGLPLFFIVAMMSKMSAIPFTVIIPLAVILFTDADFKKVMFISLMLALSSFIVMNTMFFEKITLTVAMVFASIVLFVFLRFSSVTIWVKSFFKPEPEVTRQTVIPQTGNAVIMAIKSFFAGVAFNYTTYLSFWPMVTTFSVAGVYLTSVFTAFPAFIIISAIGFGALLAFGNEKTRWWANLLIYTCLILTMFKYPVGDSIYTGFLTICLVYQIFYGDRRLLIPSMIFYRALAFFPNVTPLGYGPVALIFFRWKRTRLIAVLIAVVGIYSSVCTFIQAGLFMRNGFYSEKYTVFIALILIASLFFKRGSKWVIISFQTLSIITLLNMGLFHMPLNTQQVAHDLKARINDIGDKNNVNILSDKVDRPISFVEQPVTPKSPLQLRTGTAFEILFIYLHKVVLPYPMSFYYGYRFIEPENITDAVPVAGLLLYLVLFLLAVFCLKRYPLIGFGLMVFLISIASVSSFLYPIPGQIGERFLLIPSLGWSIVFVVIISIIFKVKDSGRQISAAGLPNGFKYSFAIMLCLYSLLTFSRNFDWKDYDTLARHDISYVSNSSQANNLLALNMMKKSYEIQDPAAQRTLRLEALGHFKKALEIYPGFYNVTYDIARVFNVLNENDSAIAYFKKAFDLDSTNSDPALFIGQMLITQGKYANAIPYLQYVLDHHPTDYLPYDRLSFAYFKLADYTHSIGVNQTAIAKLPQQTGPYLNIAHVYISLNQPDSARVYVQRAAQINPGDPNVQQLLHQFPAGK